MSELEKNLWIDFPHSIIPEEAGNLLAYLARRLRCNIEYTEQVNHLLTQDSSMGVRLQESRDVSKADGTFSLVGSINAAGGELVIIPFSFRMV